MVLCEDSQQCRRKSVDYAWKRWRKAETELLQPLLSFFFSNSSFNLQGFALERERETESRVLRGDLERECLDVGLSLCIIERELKKI